MSTDAILERLRALYPVLIDLSLGRLEALLVRLGHPERRLPPVIHVAGTNGKGSTTAYLRAIGEAAGLRVHVTTSPHLVSVTERFRIAGTLVTEQELAATLAEIERVNAGGPITVFEALAAAGFVLFARHPADSRGGRGGAGRPARRNQCRGARGGRDHGDLDGSRGLPRQHARGDRGGKGRDHQAWACRW